MTALDDKIKRLVDLISMLSAFLNGLEDARDGHAPQTRYLALSVGLERAYRDGYRIGCSLKTPRKEKGAA